MPKRSIGVPPKRIMVRSGGGSALHAAGGQAADQVLLDAHEQDDHGDDGEDGGREEVLPLDHVIAVEGVDAHGQRLERVGGDEAQGDRVLVPGVDEDEDQRGDDARGRHGEQDLHHGLDPGAAVDGGGLLHLRGDAHEGAPEQPDGERLVEGGVDEDQAQDVVRQAQALHDLVDADEQHHRGEHLGDDDEAQEGGLALELHPGQGVGRGDAADHGDDGGSAGDEDGVEHVLGHGGPAPDVDEVGPQGHDGQDGAAGEDLHPVLQGGAQHGEVGVQGDDAHVQDDEVEQEAQDRLLHGDGLFHGVHGLAHRSSSPFRSV